MTRFLISLLVALLAVALIGAAAAQEEAPVPRFEPDACLIPAPEAYAVECGYLVVPEDRAKPGSPAIRLALAIFRSNNPDKAPDPLVYLEGGPGGSALKIAGETFEQQLAPYARYRDVILLDQRGVGFSQPALDCPEMYSFLASSLAGNPTVDEEIAQLMNAVSACGSRLAASGVNLSAYNSAASAADLRDLAAVLGYDQINLMGISYGTRLALTVMRDHPEIVRSAVLGALFPPQVSLAADTPANLDRAFSALFAACAADAGCAAAYPDLEARFYELVARLNAEPASVKVIDPVAQAPFDALVNGDELYNAVSLMLYSASLLPLLPQGIAAVYDGDYSALADYLFLTLATESLISRGMYFSVQCVEDAAFDPPDTLADNVAAFPFLESFLRRSGDFADICAVWDAGAADPIENEPVSSDVPALLVSGEYDPVTPPAWGELAAETLPNAVHVVISTASHDALSTDCGAELAVAFLNDPTAELDTSCAAAEQGIAFALPGAALDLPELAFVSFTPDDGAYTVNVPEGWAQVQPGVFARTSSPTDQTVLILQSLPVTLEDFIQVIVSQVAELDAPPEVTATREANGLTWSLFEVDLFGFPTAVAAAERDGVTYAVQLVANNAAERDALREAVLLPVTDSFALAD
ncbi:MAG: alpha/beta hydrolase [Aggregatilineales bacterium]